MTNRTREELQPDIEEAALEHASAVMRGSASDEAKWRERICELAAELRLAVGLPPHKDTP